MTYSHFFPVHFEILLQPLKIRYNPQIPPHTHPYLPHYPITITPAKHNQNFYPQQQFYTAFLRMIIVNFCTRLCLSFASEFASIAPSLSGADLSDVRRAPCCFCKPPPFLHHHLTTLLNHPQSSLILQALSLCYVLFLTSSTLSGSQKKSSLSSNSVLF